MRKPLGLLISVFVAKECGLPQADGCGIGNKYLLINNFIN